ncbi:helix-turn-helix domain-containing protein [Proteus mirabilis]|uniref:helix-turn-helix domain-containing protein n=1 Tax=Proteus mirabilis TaxID=584 RepID=UPI002577EB62|nr:helix-turn-helix domain-containing protein [Proteus mirabilis]MDM3659325.1 helix-turn-helix domain-containing protein [Proteus mirabilis]MDM3670962.1 helix-turn-helix domain-containing protein [Proteus mirabilis]
MEDEILKTSEAAKELKTTPRTVAYLISKGELKGRKVGRGYRTTRSAVLDYINNPEQTHDASKDNLNGGRLCQSNKETGYGTVISLHRQGRELENLLAQKTRSKRRSCMTN